MDTFTDLIQATQDDLTINDSSSLFPQALVKRAINRAYLKASGLFRWPETEEALKTSTGASQDYYDYPEGWRPDSIWKLMVDDEDYGDPLTFKDFLYEIENDVPCGEDYLWANQWRRFFVYPTPTADGDNNIVIWGQKVVDKLEEDADVTIWSYSMPELNEAVVKEAVAILRSKGEDEKISQFKSTEAKELLVKAWDEIKRAQAKMEKTRPFFNVPDYFSGSGNLKEDITRYGNF